jgi:chromosomal replication initiation ATPase DnaA
MIDAAPRPRQIPLDLPWPRHDRASREDLIVSESNSDAVEFLSAGQWPDGRLALIGPEGCGKTHLAMIWADENDARFVEGSDAPRDLPGSGHVIFEDCDRRLSSPEAETALFHLLNILREEGGTILMTARTPPARWAVRLPDLASRLSAVTVAEINSPDDALLEHLVVKLFADRDIVIKDRLASYMAKRIDRNSAAVETAVAALDARSLELREPVGIRMAKELFGW